MDLGLVVRVVLVLWVLVALVLVLVGRRVRWGCNGRRVLRLAVRWVSVLVLVAGWEA